MSDPHYKKQRAYRRLAAVMLSMVVLVCAKPAELIGEDDQLHALKQHRIALVRSLLLTQDGAMGAAGLLAQSVVHESERHSLDPVLVLAVIQVESRFDHKAVSSRGAQGLMQVQKVAVDELVGEGKLPARRHNLKDPQVNVRIGVSYLAHLIEMFGDVNTALAAYNWGPTRIREKLTANQSIPSEYTGRVLRAQRSLEIELARLETEPGGVGAAASAG